MNRKPGWQLKLGLFVVGITLNGFLTTAMAGSQTVREVKMPARIDSQPLPW
jgi:hypothetical protein